MNSIILISMHSMRDVINYLPYKMYCCPLVKGIGLQRISLISDKNSWRD